MVEIPQAAPARRIARFRTEIDEAIAGVVGAEQYILGPRIEAFEEAFARYLGVRYCIALNSGTDALAFSLRALGIGPGDDVITSSLTAAGTAQAILHCGARPCFVDIDPLTRCLDPVSVEAAIGPQTAAIIPVHLFGQPADMPALLDIAARHGIAIVEDCAQAHGATIDDRKVGSFGNAAAFSFYPTKNLGCIGDGGAIATNDASIAAKARALRCHGWVGGERISASLGFNSRMDELQAAILTVLLRHLDEGNHERRLLAGEYRRHLQNLPVVLPPDDPGAVYHQFAIACEERDALRKHLKGEAGIETAIHYSPALHQQPAFQMDTLVRLVETERLSRQLLSLPIQPEVASRHVAYIAGAVEGGIRCKAS
jgi:dTDP-4-amino-4,6-dideoxygalactose transaminase